jgi:hypothetical protein
MGEEPPRKAQKGSADSTPRSRGQSRAAIGLQPEDICPMVTRVPGTLLVPVSRSQCQVDAPSRFPHGIIAEDAAHGCLRLGVIQQALASPATDMSTARDFATGVDAVLEQCQLLGKPEGFSVEGSPDSGASARASSPPTVAAVRETDAGASRDAAAQGDEGKEVPSPGTVDTLKLAHEEDLWVRSFVACLVFVRRWCSHGRWSIYVAAAVDVQIADLHTKSDMRGSLWDSVTLRRYTNIVFELKLAMRTKKVGEAPRST